MKKYRKIWAVLLTLAMVLGMSMTTMAANIPSEDDKANITVENVEEGATVSAYQIITAIYDKNGLVRYDWCAGDKNNQEVEFNNAGNVIGLDDTFITNYAKTKGLTATATATATGTTATLTGLTVGTYMILVTPANNVAGKSYNPMIASVNYDVKGSGSDNTAGDGSVNANSNWKVNYVVVYAKSSALALTKSVDDDTKEAAAEGRSNTGEEVTFTVTTKIPSYSDAYDGNNFKFEIKDELNTGLKYASDKPVVKVGGSEVEEGEDKAYTSDFDATKNFFTISFKQNYLKTLAAPTTNRDVVITYGAYATEAATIATPGVNTVTLTYSDSLTTTKELPPVSEKVYTFDITGAIKKVKEDTTTALPGATFTLYKDNRLSDVFATCTTDDNGTIAFSGLGALENGQTKGTGVYYLKETAAPGGYTINDTVYRVEIKNIQRTSTADDTIKSYDVVVTNMADTTKTTTTTITVGSNTPTGTTMSIVNTKLNALPSTGGIGTTIFTIGGCAIMIAAAFLFFASRKKNENR